MTMHRYKSIALAVTLAASASASHAVDLLNEGFNNVAGLTGSGWVLANASTPTPSGAGWFQGNDAVFVSQAGADNAYVASNFAIVNGPGGAGDALARLSTPVLDLTQAATLSFWTRTEEGSAFADRLNVFLDVTGGPSNQLLTINPALAVGVYPEGWTLVTAGISAMGAGATGRIVFEYNVPDTSINGNYVGIDSVVVTQVPEPTTWALMGLGLAAMAARIGRRRATA